MHNPRNFGNLPRSRWCALIVLLAVCALTVSVATRYCSPEGSSAYRVNTVHRHHSQETSRQRLTKDAANWIPELICSAVLQTRPCYPRIAPAEQPVLSTRFENSLYNRPPPSFPLLA
jgi:hypothetical protein